MESSCIDAARRRFAAAALCGLVAAMSLASPAHGHEKASGMGAGTSSEKAGALETRVGLASFYARSLHGRKTASGEAFDRTEMVAAHPRYPLGTRVRVTNRENGRKTVVRINDRGPTRANRKEGVIIDLSPAAAAKLGMLEDGRVKVRVEVLEWGGDERL